MNQGRIIALDGWRGISVAAVVVTHLAGERFSAHPGAPTIFGTLGSFGVSFFFVISGYIITRLAITEEGRDGFSIGKFYIRRFFRIIPAFYFYLGAVALLAHFNVIEQPDSGIGRALAFTCNFGSSCGWFVGHSWTLAYEEQFYIVFPIVFTLIGVRAFKAFAPALLVALTIYPLCRYWLALEGNWAEAQEAANQFSFICAGVVAAMYDDTLARWFAAKHAPYVIAAFGALLCAILIADAIFTMPLASTATHARAFFNCIMLPVSIALIVTFTAHRRTALNSILENRCVLFVGSISYSLYLWQEAFTAKPAIYSPDSLLNYPVGMIVAAIFSVYCIERPLIMLGKSIICRLYVSGQSRRKDDASYGTFPNG